MNNKNILDFMPDKHDALLIEHNKTFLNDFRLPLLCQWDLHSLRFYAA